MNLLNAFFAALNTGLATFWFATGHVVAGSINAGAAVFSVIVFFAIEAMER